ncbi:MAG: hypothetical protein JWQ79_1904 [Mucilaginibacter sp.]|nr:hypothetical protein [Mucilaginibacter sp.]
MRRIFLLFLLVISVLSEAYCQHYEKNITIQAHLKAHQKISLFYLDKYSEERIINFVNASGHDTIITKNILSEADLEIYKRLVDRNKLYEQSFLAKNKDTVTLKTEGYNLVEINNENIFPQDHLNFFNPWAIGKPFPKYTDKEIANYYLQCEEIFIANKYKIDSLYTNKKYSIQTKDYFITANKIDYYLRLFAPIDYNIEYNPRLDQYISKDIGKIKEFIDSFTDYKSSQIMSIINFITKYDMYHEKIKNDALVRIADYILTTNNWGKYGYRLMLGQIERYPDKTSSQIRQVINRLKINADSIQRIYLDRLLAFYSNRNISNPENIKLVDVKGIQINFNDLLKSYKGNLILFDFWASWCAPCREQIPEIKRLRNKYQKEKLKFISISMDEDNLHKTGLLP